MRFTGSIDAKTDEKGRVFIPASFRRLLHKSDHNGLILRRDIYQKCLVLYPESEWDAMVDNIKQHTNPFDRKGRDALRGFMAGAEYIGIDSNGRILIPRRYMEMAGISSEVRFIGMDTTIEIWDRQTADSHMADPDILADELNTIMNPKQHDES